MVDLEDFVEAVVDIEDVLEEISTSRRGSPLPRCDPPPVSPGRVAPGPETPGLSAGGGDGNRRKYIRRIPPYV
jgi:hypothetical protein